MKAMCYRCHTSVQVSNLPPPVVGLKGEILPPDHPLALEPDRMTITLCGDCVDDFRRWSAAQSEET